MAGERLTQVTAFAKPSLALPETSRAVAKRRDRRPGEAGGRDPGCGDKSGVRDRNQFTGMRFRIDTPSWRVSMVT